MAYTVIEYERATEDLPSRNLCRDSLGEASVRCCMIRLDKSRGTTSQKQLVASAQEAANRIWRFTLQSKIHHSQVIGGGFLAVASRVLFPHR